MPTVPKRQSVPATTIAMAVVFGTLFVLVEFGSPFPTNAIVIGGERYSSENVTVFGPTWSNFTDRGVTFGFHVWCGPVTPGGATLCGNATEPNGISYPFSFFDFGGPPPTQPRPWVTWISPDRQEGVQFEADSGGLAHLMAVE
jgi:hypothetical protein